IELDCVTDGAEALDYVFKRRKYKDFGSDHNPDVILLDLRLPKVDGVEVLTAIKADEKYELIPVVVLTTSSDESDLTQAMELGADNYLVKPLNALVLNKILKDLGEDTDFHNFDPMQ
ncbi:MAG: response regulator, partial [Proteobacteria bacterium]|nr:response regulator [Pseudomonadota bacterium]